MTLVNRGSPRTPTRAPPEGQRGGRPIRPKGAAAEGHAQKQGRQGNEAGDSL